MLILEVYELQRGQIISALRRLKHAKMKHETEGGFPALWLELRRCYCELVLLPSTSTMLTKHDYCLSVIAHSVVISSVCVAKRYNEAIRCVYRLWGGWA
jgi:hypothetical protein